MSPFFCMQLVKMSRKSSGSDRVWCTLGALLSACQAGALLYHGPQQPTQPQRCSYDVHPVPGPDSAPKPSATGSVSSWPYPTSSVPLFRSRQGFCVSSRSHRDPEFLTQIQLRPFFLSAGTLVKHTFALWSSPLCLNMIMIIKRIGKLLCLKKSYF